MGKKCLLAGVLLASLASAQDRPKPSQQEQGLRKFKERLLKHGEDYTYKGAVEPLELKGGTKAKSLEVLSVDTSDGLNHATELVFADPPAKPEPLCLVMSADREDTLQKQVVFQNFRLNLDGVMEKAFISRIKLDENGNAIRGSAITELQDVNSPEVQKLLQHELNFWLKGMYRKKKAPAKKESAAAKSPVAPPATK
jgi:hypothetical protein